jgi:hypothetical protein
VFWQVDVSLRSRGEQLKPEAPVGNTLPVIVSLFLYEGSPSIRHVAHCKLAV